MWLNFQTTTTHARFKMDLLNSMDFKHFSHAHLLPTACPSPLLLYIAIVSFVAVVLFHFIHQQWQFSILLSLSLYVRSFRSFIDIVSTAIYIVPIDIDLVFETLSFKSVFYRLLFLNLYTLMV